MKDIDTYTDTATEGLSTAWDMVLYKNHNGIEATADWYISNAVDYPNCGTNGYLYHPLQ